MLEFLAVAASGDTPPAWIQWLPIVGMIAIFWFLIIRPQMRQQKQHREKIAGIKKGDGKVMKVDDNYAEVEIAQGVRVKAVKATIGDIIQPGGKPAND